MSARAIASISLLKLLTTAPLSESTPIKNADVRELVFRKCLENSNRNYWGLIESLVVFDEILYDGYAFTRHKATNALKEQINALEKIGLTKSFWPVELYEKTSRAVEEYKTYLIQNGLSDHEFEDQLFHSVGEEEYHDDLFQKFGRFAFADSTGNSGQRTLFYAELGTSLGVGLLPLQHSSGTMLSRIARLYDQCGHSLMMNALEDYDSKIRPAEFRACFPPLAEKIARRSIAEGKDPITIAAEMRMSKNAFAYREHLGKLQEELREPEVSKRALQNLISDFERTVAVWGEEGDRGEGIEYKRRNLGVPTCGRRDVCILYWRWFPQGEV